MNIKIDDWSVCHSESGFYIDVQIVPRVGEFLDLHRSICSADFIKSHNEAFGDDNPDIDDSGIGRFVVKEVLHTYTKHWIEIEISVEEF